MKNGIYTRKLKTVVLKVKEQEPGSKCSSAKEACEIARSIYNNLNDNQEYFSVLFLDGQTALTGYKVVASGTMSSSLVDMRILFSSALLFGARRIICVHNHPSNGKKPSREDIALTRQIYKAGQLLDIEVLDHIILTHNDYYSMQSEGIFKRFQKRKQPTKEAVQCNI